MERQDAGQPLTGNEGTASGAASAAEAGSACAGGSAVADRDKNEGTGVLAGASPTAVTAEATGPAADDAALLRTFLSQRDAACPHCGYNLRGSRAEACPECGKPVRLALLGSARFAGHGLFILLALSWVVLACGMNATRKAFQVYDAASVAANPIRGFQVFASSTSVSINGNTTTWSTTGPNGTVTISPGSPTTARGSGPPGAGARGGGSSAGGGPVTITTTPSGTRIVQSGRTGPGGAAVFNPFGAVAPAPGTKNPPLWSAVAGSEWGLLGFWSALALAGLTELAIFLVIWRRKRQPSPTTTRFLVGTAAALFVVYAGYHAYLFAMEVRGWF